MPKELDYASALARIQNVLSSTTARPYFLGVYGHRNTGKTHLIEELSGYCFEKSIDFTAHSDVPSKVFIERIFSLDSMKDQLHMFECPWERDFDVSRTRQIINGDIDHILSQLPGRGKGVDFSVGLYSIAGGFHLKNHNNYNLVIRNDNAIPEGSEAVDLNMANKLPRGFKKGSFRQ
jgi:hypothetical protein